MPFAHIYYSTGQFLYEKGGQLWGKRGNGEGSVYERMLPSMQKDIIERWDDELRSSTESEETLFPLI